MGEESRHMDMELTTESTDKAKNKSVNPFAVGGGFLAYCVREGRLIQEGKDRRQQTKAGLSLQSSVSTFSDQ